MRFAMFLPIGVFVVMLGIAGVRLVLLARRSRQLPEFALGSGLLLLAFVGMPLAALGRIPATVGTPLGHSIFAVGIFVVMLGLSLLYVFTWRVFRADSLPARIFVVAITLVLFVVAGGISYRASQGGSLAEIVSLTRNWSLAIMSLVALNFAWGGCESFAYYAALRRRLAIGLADPVVANRFLLWGLSAVATAMLCAGMALCVLVRMAIMVEVIPLCLIALTGSVSSVTWFLTFFPPEAYRRFLRDRATK